jgi:pimeloyl-ACP methyl ester carboxylesterase
LPKSNVNGVSIYYEQEGDGFPAILIHAFPTDHAIWALQTPVLSEHYKIISVDLRGFGKSDKPKHGYQLRDFSEDIKGLMDNLGLRKAFTIGISLGGSVSAQFALDYPDNTQGNISIGTFGNMRRKTKLNLNGSAVQQRLLDVYMESIAQGYQYFWERVWKPNMGLIFHESFANTAFGSAFIKYLFEDRYLRLNDDTGALVSVLKETHDSPQDSKELFLGRLKNAKVPFAILAGEDDGTVPYGEKVHNLIKHSEFYVIKASGHFCIIDQFSQVNAILLSFLNRHNPHSE